MRSAHRESAVEGGDRSSTKGSRRRDRSVLRRRSVRRVPAGPARVRVAFNPTVVSRHGFDRRRRSPRAPAERVSPDPPPTWIFRIGASAILGGQSISSPLLGLIAVPGSEDGRGRVGPGHGPSLLFACGVQPFGRGCAVGVAGPHPARALCHGHASTRRAQGATWAAGSGAEASIRVSIVRWRRPRSGARSRLRSSSSS
jgi:hypothetical protein